MELTSWKSAGIREVWSSCTSRIHVDPITYYATDEYGAEGQTHYFLGLGPTGNALKFASASWKHGSYVMLGSQQLRGQTSIKLWASDLGIKVWTLWLGFRVEGLGSRVWGLV